MNSSILMKHKRRIKSCLRVIVGGFGVMCGLCIYNNSKKFYDEFCMPIITRLPPEKAHFLAVKIGKLGLFGRDKTIFNNLKTQVWSKDFQNPIGLAAGFDKDGESVDGMLKIGFGFVEVGSVTPNPQPGNPSPRVFRLRSDKAIINRYGFNSGGANKVFDRLLKRQQLKYKNIPDQRNLLNENFPSNNSFQFLLYKPEPGILGVNLGKNKLSKSAQEDYVNGIKKFHQVADYIVINVSSPNTPGLRSLQQRNELQALIKAVVDVRNKLNPNLPILLKIAPDLTKNDKKDIAEVCMLPNAGINGLIVTNTTISRPSTLISNNKSETGGLSGKPLKDMSTKALEEMYKLTKGSLTLIGVGGVSSGADALEKIESGASLVQIYTSLAFEGPPIVAKIKAELSQLLMEKGYKSVNDAIGAKFKINN